jgi:hypothetical protein
MSAVCIAPERLRRSEYDSRLFHSIQYSLVSPGRREGHDVERAGTSDPMRKARWVIVFGSVTTNM